MNIVNVFTFSYHVNYGPDREPDIQSLSMYAAGVSSDEARAALADHLLAINPGAKFIQFHGGGTIVAANVVLALPKATDAGKVALPRKAVK